MPNMTYPPAERDESVVDDFHGTLVPDPYRWLEDPQDLRTQTWGDAQVALTEAYLSEIPARDILRQRLTDRWNYPRYEWIEQHGGRYFFRKNDGLQAQSVLYKQASLDAEPEPLLDPNALSDDGSIALGYTGFSKDGRLMAYATVSGGSDWQEYRVRDVETGEDTGDLLQWVKFSIPVWKHDGSGFFYNSMPPQEGQEARGDTNVGSLPDQRISFHKLGTDQADDPVIYEHHEQGGYIVWPVMSDDERYLVLQIRRGTESRNLSYAIDLTTDGDPIRVIAEADASYAFIGNDGSTFYYLTTQDAPLKRLVAVDITNPDRANWRTIIPEGDDTILSVQLIGEHFVVHRMHHATSRLSLYALDGTFVKEIDLPALGTAYAITGERDHDEMFFNFTSFLYPPGIYRYDFKTGEVTPHQTVDAGVDADAYETKQVFYTSKDGTQIPMFLVHRRDLTLNGDNPTMLYAYGGFNNAVLPMFGVGVMQWLDMGGVYAVANLRGGSEYGEAWHEAGMLERKQNVFDDFIAAGEWLVENQYTRPERLAIRGGSNGGLLVAACMLQRPDLFGAVVCHVPVIDMLRYHKFTAGQYWTPEYGNAETDPEHFKFLYAYSPLHNIKAGVTYPPVLILSADHDDRVVPSHAKKFAAALQAATSGEQPVLLRLEQRAGHGFGMSVQKVITMWSDVLAFLVRQFDMADAFR